MYNNRLLQDMSIDELMSEEFNDTPLMESMSIPEGLADFAGDVVKGACREYGINPDVFKPQYVEHLLKTSDMIASGKAKLQKELNAEFEKAGVSLADKAVITARKLYPAMIKYYGMSRTCIQDIKRDMSKRNLAKYGFVLAGFGIACAAVILNSGEDIFPDSMYDTDGWLKACFEFIKGVSKIALITLPLFYGIILIWYSFSGDSYMIDTTRGTQDGILHALVRQAAAIGEYMDEIWNTIVRAFAGADNVPSDNKGPVNPDDVIANEPRENPDNSSVNTPRDNGDNTLANAPRENPDDSSVNEPREAWLANMSIEYLMNSESPSYESPSYEKVKENNSKQHMSRYWPYEKPADTKDVKKF